MKVEVTVCGKPFNGNPVGATMYLTSVQARALVALKRVAYVTKDEVVEVPHAVEVAEEVVRPRRTYRTRQLKAE